VTSIYRQLTNEEAFQFIERQVRRLLIASPKQFPTYTEGGRWVFGADPWAPTWSGGFLTGLIWALARRTGEEWWLARAREYSRLLEPRKNDGGTHDIGFIFEPSWGRWFDAEQSFEARDVLIEAGRTMANRLQMPGGYLSTWVDRGSTFIDVMMNVGIIFRAARYSGDEALYRAALRHCLTTRRFLQRGDGSTIHEGWFDPDSGEFLRAATHQGWRSDSTWARGQAWAIYGFTTAYQHTREADLLDSACRAADYYNAHTPEGVPPNDWLDPSPSFAYESSAAAIASAGMLHLADVLDDATAAARYHECGLRVLRRLRSTEFIAADVPQWEGVLRHALYHQRNRLGVDESVMWGDYYFTEALETAERLASMASVHKRSSSISSQE
jgi:unsaturated chondroitin disaccharide hydrolase